MGLINLNNYEAYLLDYFEGNLSKDLVVQLEAFVQAHPELEIDLQDNSLPLFTREDFEADFKEELFKTSNDIPNSDLLEYLEGNLNDLDKISFEVKLARHTDLQSELEALKKTFLQPDAADVFDSKNKLQKTGEQLLLNNRVISYFENTLSPPEKLAFDQELNANESLRKELELVEKTKLTADLSLVYPSKEDLLKEARVFVLFSYRTAMAAAVLVVAGLSLLFLFNGGEGKRLYENNLAAKSVVRKSHKQSHPVNSVDPGATNTVLIADKKDIRRSDKSNHEAKNIAVNSSTTVSSQQPSITPTLDKENGPALVTNTVINSPEPVYSEPVIRYTNIDALAVATDTEEQSSDIEKPKKGFWKRAVNVARQMNGLGVKAVKGEEKENESYSLSFNSFSVERK